MLGNENRDIEVNAQMDLGFDMRYFLSYVRLVWMVAGGE